MVRRCRHSACIFLRWLTVAYKQKRFPHAIASDIESLMTLGRQKGFAASLFSRLEYLWSSCSGPVSAQSDLYRLTYAIEQLKSQDWVNAVVSDEDWDNEALLVQEFSDTDALLVRKSALTGGFSDEGKLIALVEFLVTGNLSTCAEVFRPMHSRQSCWRRTGSHYNLSNRTNILNALVSLITTHSLNGRYPGRAYFLVLRHV
jgi:hypothetical protein